MKKLLLPLLSALVLTGAVAFAGENKAKCCCGKEKAACAPCSDEKKACKACAEMEKKDKKS
jgi:hypothetical protein